MDFKKRIKKIILRKYKKHQKLIHLNIKKKKNALLVEKVRNLRLIQLNYYIFN